MTQEVWTKLPRRVPAIKVRRAWHGFDRTTGINMGRIVFFEERNFQGRSFECSSDCADLHMHLSRCSSCRVDSGCFVVYDQPNYGGNQLFLRRGEYPDFQRSGSITASSGPAGLSAVSSIRSCRVIPPHRGPFRMRLFERENFGGQMLELMEDCESLQERFSMADCQSCQVLEGHWLLFEDGGFRGRMLYLRPGEYRSLREGVLGGVARVSSIRRILDGC